MAEIRWTKEAAIWLEDIYNYIARDNPEAATKVVNGIYNEIQTLKSNPKMVTVTEGEQKKHKNFTL